MRRGRIVMNMISPAAVPGSDRGLALIGALEPVTPPAGRDTLDEASAGALAARLARYWSERGFPAARFQAECIIPGRRGSAPVWGVRSNLVNGVPPRRPGIDGTARRVLRTIIAGLAAGAPVTRAWIASECRLPCGTAARLVRDLIEGGYLAREGCRRSGSWIVLRDADGRALPRAGKARAA